MKVALFSPFLSCNYGTVLQAFALAKVLNDAGHECEYLQVRLVDDNFLNRFLFIIKHPLFFLYHRKYMERKRKDLNYDFQTLPEFIHTFKLNKDFCDANTPINPHVYSYDQLSSLETQYDLFIVGSDQTWSPNAFYQYSANYLRFIKQSNKKVSYGSSFGTNYWSTEYKKFISKHLKAFGHLSCRDTFNTHTLVQLLQRQVTNVLDPTLLLNASIWTKYCSMSLNVPSNYILCYILGEKKCIFEYAEMLSREKNLPIVYIETRPSIIQSGTVLKGLGVQEFLWLVKHCDFMVTDSFHGTIFSINFEKEFISFNKHDGVGVDNGRIFDVLTEFNISDRFHEDTNMSLPSQDIDYEAVRSILKYKRKISMDYLMNCVKE